MATLKAAGGAKVPVGSTGTRDSVHRRRARTARRALYPEVAPRRSDPSSSAGPLRCSGRFRVHDRGDYVARSHLKNQALTLRERLATPRGMSPDRRLEGRPTLTCTAVEDGNYVSAVSWTATTALAPRLATPARLEAATTLRALRSLKTPALSGAGTLYASSIACLLHCSR